MNILSATATQKSKDDPIMITTTMFDRETEADGMSHETDGLHEHEMPFAPEGGVDMDESEMTTPMMTNEMGEEVEMMEMMKYGMNDPELAESNFKDKKNDNGVRFNKITGFGRLLNPDDFPLDFETARSIRKLNGVSVMHQEDCANCKNIGKMIKKVANGCPSMPGTKHFWQMMRETVNIQIQREADLDPHTMLPLPDQWSDFDAFEVAKAVHDEFPGIHHIELMGTFMSQKAKINRTVVPSDCQKEFVRGPVMLADLVGFSIRTVAPTNFGAKWYCGRPRPEEIAIQVKDGTIQDVPEDIVAALDYMPFQNQTAFTAYPEGSPTHPSWPAMHSAASAGSLWLALVMDLNATQTCELKKLDYAIAYARTVAGVHYPDDNIDGLNMGQEILAKALPKFFEKTYQADRAAVEARIAELRFDWNDFLTSDCVKGWTPPDFSDAMPKMMMEEMEEMMEEEDMEEEKMNMET